MKFHYVGYTNKDWGSSGLDTFKVTHDIDAFLIEAPKKNWRVNCVVKIKKETYISHTAYMLEDEVPEELRKDKKKLKKWLSEQGLRCTDSIAEEMMEKYFNSGSDSDSDSDSKSDSDSDSKSDSDSDSD